MRSPDRRLHPPAALAAALLLLMPAAASAFRPPEPGEELQPFTAPELRFGVEHQRLADAPQAVPRADAWSAFLLRHGQEIEVFVDPRSGVPANVVAAIPLLPGDGFRNRVTLDELSAALGRPVDAIDAAVVADRVRRFVADHREALGIDVDELADLRASEAAEGFWMVHAERAVDGVPVRHAHLSAVVKHGNLILLGANVWGEVEVPTRPAIAASDAIDRGFAALGGTRPADRFWREPELELIPTDAPNGYGYRLAWAFGFTRGDDPARWEVLIDAHDGTVLSLEDTIHYATGRVRGNVYPNTNTGICPTDVHGKVDFTRCGTMQNGYPMPWADFTHAGGLGFTDGAGEITYPGGAANTTLNGSFIGILDGCGAVNEAHPAGQIQMGGVNGDHDCVSGGVSPGNTASARTAFNEVGKTREAALGWLPGNAWLTGQLLASTNQAFSCNAFYGGNQIFMAQSSAQCTNTGEVAAILDHEWGHGLDDFDTNGLFSNPSEAYADIAAIYRLQTSCVGYNFFNNLNFGCGMTADGTGFNANEAQVGPAVCDLDCSGARDADWQKISLGAPGTPQNFVCPSCGGGGGPCGRQVHCAAAPPRQAAWDLAARDLQAAPHFYDTNSAFIVANRLFHQGSGNIANWYECDCAAGTSAGCAATSAYMSWLAADDDNGNVLDGTPHMTALYAAFDRHNIACQVPAPFDTGCFGAPTQRPDVTLSRTADTVSLSWNAIPGATEYWVMRSEGFTACTQSKTRIARVNATAYTDTEVLVGHQYCYSIVPATGDEACHGPASICTCTTPWRCGSGSVTRLKEGFDAGIPATWTVVDGGAGGGASATWNTANPCGLVIAPPVTAPWAEVNSQCAGVGATQNEELITPEVKVGDCGRVELRFSEQFAWNAAGIHEIADVDVMTFDAVNGWTDWINVRRLENGSNGFPSSTGVTLDLTPQTRGESKLKVRFHYYDGSGDGWWAVDDVAVLCRCPLIIAEPDPVPHPNDPVPAGTVKGAAVR